MSLESVIVKAIIDRVHQLGPDGVRQGIGKRRSHQVVLENFLQVIRRSHTRVA
jgi:hypothetical protein